MKRRIIALILAVCLSAVLGVTAFAAAYDGYVNVENVVEGGKRMYSNFEGNYDSVVPCDSGAVGMGIMGWRGYSALRLLKLICSTAPELSRQALGDALYSEIVNTALVYPAWETRKFNSTEAANTSILLGTQVGIDCENELARQDITRQIGEAWNEGIRSDAAILYYCSISNHYGPGGASNNFMPDIRAALGIVKGQTIDSLEVFHNAVLKAAQTSSYVYNTLTYRINVYNYIKNTLGWDVNGGASTPVTPLNPGGSQGGTTDPGTHDENPETSRYYNDVLANSWMAEGIEYVTEHNIFQGTATRTFSPQLNMTRAMVVTVLYRIEGCPQMIIYTAPNYQDVPKGSYYETPVIWANSFKVINGVTSTQFAPDESVTREQLATMLFRYASRKGLITAADQNASSLRQFSDGGKTSDYAQVAMAWAVDNGLIRGVGGGGKTLLDPQGPATRAQVATIVMRYMQNIVH